MKLGLAISTVLLASFLASGVNAAPVYKWVDEEGTVHFSSEKPTKGAKPAELPPINRGEVKLTDKKLLSCGNHGGIDCQAGPDTDGSVICYDGFRDASARYRFSCASPKLAITDISPRETDGSFKVFVRNSRAVDAKNPRVRYQLGEGREEQLAGPATIEAFGLAEFTFTPDEGVPVLQQPVARADLVLSCDNC